MALPPQTQKQHEILLQAEAIIDKYISESLVGDRITIAAKLLPPLTFIMLQKLRNAYLLSGWRVVEMVSDQRDGDFFDLQA